MMKIIKKILQFAVVVVMLTQIALSFWWMKGNINVQPPFGDTTEYIQMSQDLILDEYRPILYPLFLRFLAKISIWGNIPYVPMVYIVQAVISFISILIAVVLFSKKSGVLVGIKSQKGRILALLLGSLYIFTIPMITFMNFTILTDSIATSMLFLICSCMILLITQQRVSPITISVLILAVCIESLVRADRLYSCLVLLLLCFIIRIFRMEKKKINIVMSILIVFFCVLVVQGVNEKTMVKGAHGRVSTSLNFVLLDRIVWPNMRANYDDFPDYLKEIISKKDAKKFDKQNNNVMYMMAPMLEEALGEDGANKAYLEMAKIVFSNQPGKVLTDIGEDILCVVATPLSCLAARHDIVDKGDGWNLTCMSTGTEELSARYDSFYLSTFVFFLFPLSLILFWRKKQSRYKSKINREQGFSKIALPYIAISLIIALWFSIGDGAPPNDRYALIIYGTWAMGILYQIVFLFKSEKEEEFYVSNI